MLPGASGSTWPRKMSGSAISRIDELIARQQHADRRVREHDPLVVRRRRRSHLASCLWPRIRWHTGHLRLRANVVAAMSYLYTGPRPRVRLTRNRRRPLRWRSDLFANHDFIAAVGKLEG